MVIFYCIIILLFNYLECIDIPLSISEANQLYINVYLGNPAQELRLKLVTSTNKFLVKNYAIYKSGFNPQLSQTFVLSIHKNELTYQNHQLSVQYARDSFIIGTYNTSSLSFALIQSGSFNPDFDGVIGLGYSNKDLTDDYTLLDTINEIQPKIFIVKYRDQLLSIGERNLIYEKSKLYKQCNLINLTGGSNHNYQCLLDSAFINIDFNNTVYYYKVNKEVSFNTGANVILVSQVYFEYLQKAVFSDLISKGICGKNNDDNINYIYCKETENINLNGKIWFVIGKWSVSLDLNDLIRQVNGYKIFSILYDSNQKEQWMLGVPLMEKYNIVFNKEEKKIGVIKNDFQ